MTRPGTCRTLLCVATLPPVALGAADHATVEGTHSVLGEVVSVADSIAMPADLPADKYTLSVGVVDESSAPVVRLGIKGREEDGWYPISKVQIVH